MNFVDLNRVTNIYDYEFAIIVLTTLKCILFYFFKNKFIIFNKIEIKKSYHKF